MVFPGEVGSVDSLGSDTEDDGGGFPVKARRGGLPVEARRGFSVDSRGRYGEMVLANLAMSFRNRLLSIAQLEGQIGSLTEVDSPWSVSTDSCQSSWGSG